MFIVVVLALVLSIAALGGARLPRRRVHAGAPFDPRSHEEALDRLQAISRDPDGPETGELPAPRPAPKPPGSAL